MRNRSHRFSRFGWVVLIGFTWILGIGKLEAESSSDRESFAPLTVTLQPQVSTSPLPSWVTDDGSTDSGATNGISIQPESDAVSIPVPALATLNEIGAFALTVIFQDNGDGGPVVEWQSKEGGRVLLSPGLGTMGLSLGLNARTLLLTQALDLDGGIIRVSFAGRFNRLLSLSLRPAKELGIATLDDEVQPALFMGNDHVIGASAVSGIDETIKHGDTQRGNMIRAELSASPQRLDTTQGNGPLEFVVPLASTPQGSYLHAEVADLDPSSWIKVEINGVPCGALGMASFPLDDPQVVIADSGQLLFAGWRNGSLFIPRGLWKEGENSVMLTLERGTGDQGQAVYLQNTVMDLLLPASGSMPSTSTEKAPSVLPLPSSPSAAAPSSLSPADAEPSSTPTPTTSEALSTGSLYGNPSPALFHATPGTITP